MIMMVENRNLNNQRYVGGSEKRVRREHNLLRFDLSKKISVPHVAVRNQGRALVYSWIRLILIERYTRT